VLAAALGRDVYAGRQSTRLDSQPATAPGMVLAQQLASSQLRSSTEVAKREQMEQELSSSGAPSINSAVNQTKGCKEALSKANHLSSTKAIIDRERQLRPDNTRLIAAFGSPGARLLAMKGAESAAARPIRGA